MEMIRDAVSIILIILAMILFAGCDLEEEKPPEPKTYEYKVVSVSRYVKTQTDKFGRISKQELAYCFTYIDEDNTLHEMDNFKHREYGLTKVAIGDENKYIIQEDMDTHMTLVLTEDTLNNMEVEE